MCGGFSIFGVFLTFAVFFPSGKFSHARGGSRLAVSGFPNFSGVGAPGRSPHAYTRTRSHAARACTGEGSGKSSMTICGGFYLLSATIFYHAQQLMLMESRFLHFLYVFPNIILPPQALKTFGAFRPWDRWRSSAALPVMLWRCGVLWVYVLNELE